MCLQVFQRKAFYSVFIAKFENFIHGTKMKGANLIVKKMKFSKN